MNANALTTTRQSNQPTFDGARREPMRGCVHCYHVADRDDCRRYGIERKKEQKCCKCGHSKGLSW